MNEATVRILEGDGLPRHLSNQSAAVWEEVLSSIQPQIFQIASTIVKNHHDAQEITQDTLLAIYRKIGTFRGDSKLFTWVHRITLNNSFMKLRHRRKEPHLHLDEVPGQDGEEFFPAIIIADKGKIADEWISEREFMHKVFHAVDRLPGKYREIMRLEISNDYSHAELGRRLNLSVAAVKSRLFRARILLREKMKHFIVPSN